MKKFKYLLLIMLATFMSVTSVNAETNIYRTSLSSIIYTSNDTNYTINSYIGRDIAGISFVGFNAPNTTRRQIYYFNNLPIENYDILDFNIYVGNLAYVSSTIRCDPDSICYEASFDNTPPLVIFGGNMCSVISLGHTNYYGDNGYNYEYIYHAQCKAYNKTSNNVQILYLPPPYTTSSNVYFGISTPIIMNQSTDGTLNDIDESVKDLNENITSSDTIESESQANSFFDGFSVTDNGGISSIITSPLVAINSMIEGTCSPLKATFRGKTLTLPCGDTFWASMPDIKEFLNIVLGGFLCYGILSKLYLLIDRLKNPDDDRVEVMKL